ncbi:acyltransferase [Microbacterium sp. SD291]|uniref:acyltransferase family protein n=1 Tax=Microbacterium sp. SD291 TaxID=2782007 RepID=UPI001A95FAB1|nr:acyltransferase [Microbacterium sp. SD291]MBO0981002.1 acyltransferase [Microbacterium sp. SD291]
MGAAIGARALRGARAAQTDAGPRPRVGARRLPYLPALDGLRAVGVALVLINHAAAPYQLPGGFGVDIFFVLSGFLITTLLWYELDGRGRIDLPRFYARRAIRLVPALLVVLAASTVLALLLLDDMGRFLLDTAAAALYLSPLADAILGESAFYGHLWTLAAEEYFYLLWPLALILMIKMRFGWRTMSVIMFTGGIALYALRVIAASTSGSELSLLRMGGIAIGCGVALIVAESNLRGNAAVNAVLSVALLAAAWLVTGRGAFDALYAPLAATGTALVIFAMLGRRRSWIQRVLETAPFVFLGRISYELYLWHVPLLLGAALMFSAERSAIWWWVYPAAIALAAATHFGLAPLQRRWRVALT